MSLESPSKTHLLVAFGNPLMDITIEENVKEILEKYGCMSDSQAEVDHLVMESLMEDVSRSEAKLDWHPGGSASNTARVVAWLGGRSALFGGASASHGAVLRKEKVLPGLQIHPTLPTGRCVSLVNGHRRALIACIAAALHFDLDFLQASEYLQHLIQEASIIYIEGYFIENRIQTCKYIVEELHLKKDKPFGFNISAVYVVEKFPQQLKFMAEHADIVFGNVNEFGAVGRICYGLQSAEECLDHLHELSKKKQNIETDPEIETDIADSQLLDDITKLKIRLRETGKILVMTQDSKAVLVVWGKDEPSKQWIQVPKLAPEDIVDTTGAGDAFTAGFLWAFMQGDPIESCVFYGCKVAAVMIGEYGTVLPDRLPHTIERATLRDLHPRKAT